MGICQAKLNMEADLLVKVGLVRKNLIMDNVSLL